MKQELNQKESPGKYWQSELTEAEEAFDKWFNKGRKIIERYRDERGGESAKKFNVLWANTQIMQPALYGRPAKPEATRRWKDRDPIARSAALMLQGCLQYDLDMYPDFDQAMRGAVEDRLLPGRGTAWIRFDKAETERAVIDYVYWQDFLHNPARTWEEVWWVARKVYMTKAEGIDRFGEDFENVPLTYEKIEDKELPQNALRKQAEVFEIWDKTDQKVRWVAKGYDVVLDEQDNLLQLHGFFPCPKPLYSTTTTGSLIPVPDFTQYQDQADEVDTLTQRIHSLTTALKVAGVYNAEYKELNQLLNEGFENQMIAVDNWAAFAEKGGMKGAMEFLPIEDVVKVLKGLYEAREIAKQVIYEIIGISDIIRGSSDPNETLGAQQLKSQYGSKRLVESQRDVANFATGIIRLKAEIITRFFKDETIVRMSGAKYQIQPEFIPPALQLLRDELYSFCIMVAADSLAQLNEREEKEQRMEFLHQVGTFMEKALPVVQASPDMGQLVSELLLFGVRSYPVGASIENTFEEAMAKLAQGPQIPPQVQQQLQQLQQENQQLKNNTMMEAQKLKDSKELEQYRAMEGVKIDQAKASQDMQLKQQTTMQQSQMMQQKMLAEQKFAQDKAMAEMQKDIEVAKIEAASAEKQNMDTAQAIQGALSDLNETMKLLAAPKEAVRGSDGKILYLVPKVK
jgi:hypothetical protein